MPADVAELRIKVVSDDVKKADARLKRLDSQSRKTEKTNKKLGKSFVGIGVAVAGLAVATRTLWSVFNNVRTLEKLNARLITATGSVENANIQMNELRETATKMPQTLAEITDAFIIMKNLGLTPTEDSLLSFANTASATGKTLDQFVQAVADAITFEFERLKEFGIRARQEGDKIRFIFQGASTTVGKNAAEIEGFLKGLGETEFAGGIALQMETIDGKLSNLADAWFNFTNSIASGKFAGKAIDELTGLLRDVTSANELSSYAESISDATSLGINNGIERGFSNVEKRLAVMNVEPWGIAGKTGIEGIPMLEKLIKLRNQVAKEQEAGVGFIFKPVNQEQTGLLKEALELLKQQKAAQDALNAAQEESQRIRTGKAAISDRRDRLVLKRLSVSQQLANVQDKQLGSLVDLALGIDKDGGKINVDAVERRLMAEDKLAEQLQNKSDKEKERAQSFILSLKTEEEQIIAGYDRQISELETFLESKHTNLVEAGEAQIELEKRKNESLKQLDEKGLAGRTAAARDFFAGLDVLAQGENEKLFQINKAFALADAVVSGQQALAKAMALGFPANIIPMAMAAAQSAIQVSTISSTQFAGNFNQGGVIPGNSFAGDSRNINVNSGERVLTTAQQDRFFNNGGNMGGGVKIINNNYGVETTQTTRQDDDGQQVVEFTNRVIQGAVSAVNEGFIRGGGATDRSLAVALRRHRR